MRYCPSSKTSWIRRRRAPRGSASRSSRSTRPEAAAELGVDPDVRGAYVAGVVSGGPADEAGVAQDSVITSLDGAEISSAEDLTDALADLSPGDDVDLSITTSSGTSEISVRLGQAPVT